MICPTASRIFHDWSEALREASSPSHRQDEELITSYAGAVGKELDRHLAACAFCKEPTMKDNRCEGGNHYGCQCITPPRTQLEKAAPELLEACELAIANLAGFETSEHVLDKLSAAIAKATGG